MPPTTHDFDQFGGAVERCVACRYSPPARACASCAEKPMYADAQRSEDLRQRLAPIIISALKSTSPAAPPATQENNCRCCESPSFASGAADELGAPTVPGVDTSPGGVSVVGRTGSSKPGKSVLVEAFVGGADSAAGAIGNSKSPSPC